MRQSEPSQILGKSRPRVSILDYPAEKITTFLREKLTAKQVEEAHLFGSVASGAPNAWSDIDVLIIEETATPFIERAAKFSDLYDLEIPVDILVYTRQEFSELAQSNTGFWHEFNKHHIRLL